jgi:hypothetical protein
MNKIKRSFHLLKTSFAILLREKKLLLFPFINSGVALAVALFFIGPVVLYPTGHPYSSAAHWSAVGERLSHAFSPHDSTHQPTSIGVAAGFVGSRHLIFQHGWFALFFAVIYFLSMFLGTFCNVAFYHEIMQALNGQAVSIRRGFQHAMMRWRAILLWSLFAGLVGYLIRAIEQRVGFLGRIIAGLVGFAWSVACIFIIPTLVRDTETENPVKLLRHSAGTLKRTWGELVVGFIGMDAALFFIILPVIFLAGMIGSVFHHIWMPLFVFAAMFLLMLPLSWIKNVVNAVYRCALFIYATEGVIPEPFDKELLDSAWKVK